MFVHTILLQFADVISWFRLCHDGGKSEEFSKTQKCRLKELGLPLNNNLTMKVTMKVKVIKSAWNSKVVFCMQNVCCQFVFLSIKCQHLIVLVQKRKRVSLPGGPRKSSDVSRRLEAEQMSQKAWSFDI